MPCLDCGGKVHRKSKRCLKCFNAAKRKPNGKYYVHAAKGFEHVVVWTKANGPVPKGFVVHHKDENHRNNSLDNLDCISRQHHLRIHAGWELRDGEWFKPCSKCKVKKPLSEFYPNRTAGTYQGPCKDCTPERWKKTKEPKQSERVS